VKSTRAAQLLSPIVTDWLAGANAASTARIVNEPDVGSRSVYVPLISLELAAISVPSADSAVSAAPGSGVVPD
jgi:hypothetical protein